MNTRKITCYILTVIVVFLFVYSMIGTAEFLNIHKKSNNNTTESTEIIDNYSKKDILNLEGNTSANLSQHYQSIPSDEEKNNGNICITDKYIYKTEKINNKYVILQVDKKTGDSFPLISDYKCRNLLVIDKFIYCIVETQNGEDINVEKIAKISIEDYDITFFDSTESTKITSLLSDGKELYYTKKDNKNIYKINLKGDIYSYIYTLDNSTENPYLFNIKDSELYYVDGYEMAKINLYTYEKENISYQYCNKKLNPIMVDDTIYVFKTLSKNELVAINTLDNNIDIIFDEKLLTKNNIKLNENTNINYSKNIIFFNSGNEIYYINVKSQEIGQIEEIDSTSKVIYIDNKSLITEANEYGFFTSTPITWLFAK